jgi:hypothetical protein
VLCKAERPDTSSTNIRIERPIRIIELATGVSVIITLPVFHARALLEKGENDIR